MFMLTIRAVNTVKQVMETCTAVDRLQHTVIRKERKWRQAIVRSDFSVDNGFVMQMYYSFEHIVLRSKTLYFNQDRLLRIK